MRQTELKKYRCDSCDRIYKKSELLDVGELDSGFLSPGVLIPHGRCKDENCGAGCYPILLDTRNKDIANFHNLAVSLVHDPINLNKEQKRHLAKSLDSLSHILRGLQ